MVELAWRQRLLYSFQIVQNYFESLPQTIPGVAAGSATHRRKSRNRTYATPFSVKIQAKVKCQFIPSARRNPIGMS
jgi:hypothetical protein